MFTGAMVLLDGAGAGEVMFAGGVVLFAGGMVVFAGIAGMVVFAGIAGMVVFTPVPHSLSGRRLQMLCSDCVPHPPSGRGMPRHPDCVWGDQSAASTVEQAVLAAGAAAGGDSLCYCCGLACSWRGGCWVP